MEESNQSKISTLDRLVKSHQEQAREHVLQSMSCLRDVISIGEEKEDEYTSLIEQLEMTCKRKDQETQRIEKAVGDLNSQLLTLQDELTSQTTQRDKTRAEYLKAKDRLSYEKEKRALAEDKYRETNHQLRSEKEVQRILLRSFDTFYSIFESQAQEINLLLVSCQSLIQEFKASKDIPSNPPPLNQVMQGFALDTSKLNMTGLNDLLKNFSQTTLSLTPQKMDNKAKFVPVKANSIKLQQYDPKEAVFGRTKIVLEAVVADQTRSNRVPEVTRLLHVFNSYLDSVWRCCARSKFNYGLGHLRSPTSYEEQDGLCLSSPRLLSVSLQACITVYRNGKIHSFHLPPGLLMVPALDQPGMPELCIILLRQICFQTLSSKRKTAMCM